MANFVGGDDDPAEAARVLDNGDAVHLFEALVDDAGAPDVRKTWTP